MRPQLLYISPGKPSDLPLLCCFRGLPLLGCPASGRTRAEMRHGCQRGCRSSMSPMPLMMHLYSSSSSVVGRNLWCSSALVLCSYCWRPLTRLLSAATRLLLDCYGTNIDHDTFARLTSDLLPLKRCRLLCRLLRYETHAPRSWLTHSLPPQPCLL